MTRVGAALVLLATCIFGGCGAATPVAKATSKAIVPKTMRVVREPGRAAIAIVTREGDPEPFAAAFVSTNGITDENDKAVVAVALAGLFQSRLASARVTPQGDGVRVVAPASELAHLTNALVEPVTAATDLAVVNKKVAALAALPRPRAEELPIATCEGAMVPAEVGSPPTAAELERWRARAVVNERVGFGVVGASLRAPALPAGSRAIATSAPAERFAVQGATGDAPVGTVNVAIAWRTGFSAVSAAAALGDPRSSLTTMLAMDGVAHLRSVSGTLSPEGACLALRLRVDADASTSGGAQHIARTIALAETKARDALADATEDITTPADASAAAEQASIVALASAEHVAPAEPYVLVGAPGAASETRESLSSALADATRAWASPIVEARTRVERGQPAAWMLIASPCGTAGETDTDAGASAAFAVAAATSARARGVASEPWIANDGVGVIASAPNARALADALARTVLVEPLEGVRAAQGLLHDAARPGLAGLALALAPGRPASIVPTGTPLSLLRVSEPAILARAESLRRGPLRVALLVNEGAPDAPITRVDRWVLREGARACPAQAAIATAKPGTYAVATDDGTSEAYLALAVPASYEAEAVAIAGVLDRELLAKALSDGLARESSARVLGPPGGRALVVHVEAPAGALDAAVAQTRALLDRIRQGAIADVDLVRFIARTKLEIADKMRDPRERLIALFRGEPAKADVAIDAVRTAAAAFIHDDALVIVAARPRVRRAP
jgi:hypothetical protein